jgi:hypothetical protein
MTEHDLSARRYEIEGRDLGYPARFRDGASAAGLFVVRARRVANELRRLGLPRRPLLATWNGHLDFSMSAPEKL